MANKVYPLYRQALLSGTAVDLTTLNIKVVLVDLGAYTYSDAHDFLNDVAAGARIATTGNLGSKTVANGVFDAADIALPDTGGNTAEALIVYADSGVESTSRLLCFIDTGVTGLPITRDSVADSIQWNASGIFEI